MKCIGNKSRGFKRVVVLAAIITLIILSSIATFAGEGIGGSENVKIINETQFEFWPGYQQKMGYSYGNHRFTLDFYAGQYGIFSPLFTGDTKPYETIRKYLDENTQKVIGAGGEHLVVSSDYNLKKGSIDPAKTYPNDYNGDNSGNFYYTPDPSGNYEFRYIGYTSDGMLVDNPLFPADKRTITEDSGRDWQTFNEMISYPSLRHTMSEYNDDEFKAKKTFDKWFSSTATGAKFLKVAISKGYTNANAWSYWNNRLSILSDIDVGAGILKGWHKDNNGGLWYISFAIPQEAETNVGVTSLQILDPNTNKVLAEFKNVHSTTNPFNFNLIQNSRTDSNLSLKKGVEYIVKAQIKYFSKAGTDAKTTPIEINRFYAYDNDDYNVYDESYLQSEGKGLVSLDNPTRLKNKQVANFEWKFTVPNTLQSKGLITVKVPDIFKINNDNLVGEDDWASLKYTVGKNDIGFIEPLELFDSQGMSVDYPRPNEAHTAVFNIKHFIGDVAIGLDAIKNPKTTIDFTITDGTGTVIRTGTMQASSVLNPKEVIKMELSNVATNTSYLKVCATINAVHAEKGLNSDPSNDKICREFRTVKNYAIKELKITPHYINIPENKTSSTGPLKFEFIVAHESSFKSGEFPVVVVKKDGQVIHRESVVVPVGSEMKYVWTIPVPVQLGNNDFTIEVNPAPRTVTEFRGNGLDAYADNIKTDTVVVRKNPKCIDCVKVRTYNSWTEKFNMREVQGYRYYTKCWDYYVKGKDIDGLPILVWYKYDCDWCITTSDKSWTEVVDFYEEYRIDKIYFRSKWSKDIYGGDGWINLLTKDGKIKQGYGFELKIITVYQTNRGNIGPVPPNPWYNDCSYYLRSPGISELASPTIVSLEMPYDDVCYLLTPSYLSEDWRNRQGSYELPSRDSFGLATEKKIYINEDATPGSYPLKINTPLFDGYSPEAPVDVSNKKTLQDCKTVYIEILVNDDLKSHIIQ